MHPDEKVEIERRWKVLKAVMEIRAADNPTTDTLITEAKQLEGYITTGNKPARANPL